jgi:hypothetical protein
MAARMERRMKKEFVTFYSPGTFVHEMRTLPIDSWNVKLATKMASSITERYDATPFGFRFSTRSRGPDDLDSKITAESPMYYLGGTVRTIDEVLSGTDPNEEILRCNVSGNKFKRILTNDNSWRVTVPLEDSDIVLEWVKP